MEDQERNPIKKSSILLGAVVALVVGIWQSNREQSVTEEPPSPSPLMTTSAQMPTPRPEMPAPDTAMARDLEKMGQHFFDSEEKSRDSKQVRMKVFRGDDTALPNEVQAAIREAKERQKKAFESESLARQEIPNLAGCVSGQNNVPKLPAKMSAQLPANVRSQFADMGAMAQVQCVKMAMQLAEKFPSLRQDMKSQVINKASPRSRELAKQAQ